MKPKAYDIVFLAGATGMIIYLYLFNHIDALISREVLSAMITVSGLLLAFTIAAYNPISGALELASTTFTEILRVLISELGETEKKTKLQTLLNLYSDVSKIKARAEVWTTLVRASRMFILAVFLAFFALIFSQLNSLLAFVLSSTAFISMGGGLLQSAECVAELHETILKELVRPLVFGLKIRSRSREKP